MCTPTCSASASTGASASSTRRAPVHETLAQLTLRDRLELWRGAHRRRSARLPGYLQSGPGHARTGNLAAILVAVLVKGQGDADDTRASNGGGRTRHMGAPLDGHDVDSSALIVGAESPGSRCGGPVQSLQTEPERLAGPVRAGRLGPVQELHHRRVAKPVWSAAGRAVHANASPSSLTHRPWIRRSAWSLLSTGAPATVSSAGSRGCRLGPNGPASRDLGPQRPLMPQDKAEEAEETKQPANGGGEYI
jgi:hypothetical protein